MTRHQFEAEKLPPEIQQIADRMNIEPDRIPLYKLPELPFSDSVSADDFLGRIRPELVRIMAENIYGPIPPHCDELVFRPPISGEKPEKCHLFRISICNFRKKVYINTL